MGQSQRISAEVADTVITNALIVDHWGIVKADIGIRDGRITAIGKAGNPDIMSGVHPDLVVGPSTEVISGNGRILTAGAVDCHVHLICPQIMEEALGGGITTIVAGGTGPAEGSKATTVSEKTSSVRPARACPNWNSNQHSPTNGRYSLNTGQLSTKASFQSVMTGRVESPWMASNGALLAAQSSR